MGFDSDYLYCFHYQSLHSDGDEVDGTQQLIGNAVPGAPALYGTASFAETK